MSTSTLLQEARKLVPSLTNNKHKGQDGRIGIVGGSVEFTGAPYFAGMSAYRTGADLVHIFCSKEASIPIKSYSPELMVHPVLDSLTALEQIEQWLERLHVLVIGPGLGRDETILNSTSKLIKHCKNLSKPLVIDADGLFLVSQNPSIIKNYPQIVITPNAIEFTRLAKAFLNKKIESDNITDGVVKDLARAIGPQAIVLLKGKTDIISNGITTIHSSSAGSGRRCGGQGDLVSGAVAVFTWWANNKQESSEMNSMYACYAASRLIRETNAATFKVKNRGMLAHDMIEFIAPTFNKFFEIDNIHSNLQ